MPLPKKIPRSKGAKPDKAPEKRVLANRYRVEKRLGSGNFGTAWLVTDLKCKDPKEQLKVLKEISVGDLQPDETVDAMHEANLLRNLDHPGIVKFHDSFIDQENFCIITEYCEGGDLDHKIIQYKKQGKTFPEPIIIEWLIQLLLAVQYMHSRRVLHRDLKTRNIFLRHNMIKIGDFGISRILMGTTDMASTFTGTPYYMSPEVLKHEGYNSKSDVWSVGCMLYELVTLKHAFEGQSLMGVMYKIVEGDLPSWPEAYSKDLHHVFQSILEKDPAKRPSASEVLKLPFIAKQMEVLKNTMMDKHFAKEQKDSINQESQEIAKALKKKSRLDQLKKESDDAKWKNMSPRERMRLRKQQKADEEAKRIHGAARQQLADNAKKYNEIRETMNAYKTHAPPWLRRGDSGKKKERQEDNYGLDYEPFKSGIPDYEDLIESDDEEDYDDDEDIQYGNHGGSLPLHRANDGDEHFHANKHLTVSNDDRPITPMRDKMVYNIGESSLDFKDGVPDKPELAETYYSQFDDEFEEIDEDEEDCEGTLLATVVGAASAEGTGEDDVGDLIQHMQTALNKEDTIKSSTVTDDLFGAFGPKARDLRIKHIRTECEKKLGKKEFEAAYDYLKRARFSKNRESADEAKIMKDLKQFVKDPSDCFMVDQLLFLEEQAKL